MTTSQSDIALSSPVPGEKIPPGTLGYFQARNKYNAFNLFMDEFTASGISQAELARRLGKGTDVVCRWLSGPGNWTLDTMSDLLFAVSGGAPVYDLDYPLTRPRRNQIGPGWLYDDTDDITVRSPPSGMEPDVASRELDVPPVDAIVLKQRSA